MTRLKAISLALGMLIAFPPSPARSEPTKAIRDAIKNLQKSKNVEERVDAAEYLGGFEDPAAIEALAQALSDRSYEVQEAAASALWHTGEKAVAAKPALLKALQEAPARVIVRAAGALEVMGVSAEDLADARRRVLERRTDETTAFLAARGLIGLDPPSTILPTLLGYLSFCTREAARPDASSDERDNLESAGKAVMKLAETNDRKAIAPLRAELDRNPSAAPLLLNALATFKPPPDRFAQTLVQQMDSRDTSTREIAARLCRDLTSDADIALWAPEVAALTRDRNEGVRSAAVFSLDAAAGRAASAAPDLVRLLGSEPSPDLRKRAARALSAVGDASQPIPQKTKLQVAEQAKQALITAATSDKDKDVAEEAIDAYNQLFLPSTEAVDALIQVAEGRGPTSARKRAVELLGRRQGQGKAVLARVRVLAKSADLATEAKEAAEWIERGGPGSPNPLVAAAGVPKGNSPALSSPGAISGATAAPASASAKHDPDAEARGLATLRKLKIEFDEAMFDHTVAEANLEGVRAFLDAGMSANHRFANDAGRSPLHVLFFSDAACTEGEPSSETAREVVKTLLAAGADVNQVDDNTNTPLMFAASKCDRFVMRLLIAAGAKVGLRDSNNFTALDAAISSGNPGAEELIAAGARLDAQKAKDWLESYKDNPKAIALIRKAMVK